MASRSLLSPLLAVALSVFIARTLADPFVISNGQIFTPGFAIVDAPQPGTPEGGDILQVALDVSTDGKLQLPPYPANDPSQIFNITIFLYSYTTGRNFTITNGTATAGNASLGDIMQQEPGSTVKHVDWTWPDCLVGNGPPTGNGSDRGVYNISIRQNFRLNGSNYYTIFDLPIGVTNSISNDTARPSCDSLNNQLLTPEQLNGTANDIGVLFAPNESQVIETNPSGSATTTATTTASSTTGIGPEKPEATTGSGLGAASTMSWFHGAPWLCLGGALLVWSL